MARVGARFAQSGVVSTAPFSSGGISPSRLLAAGVSSAPVSSCAQSRRRGRSIPFAGVLAVVDGRRGPGSRTLQPKRRPRQRLRLLSAPWLRWAAPPAGPHGFPARGEAAAVATAVGEGVTTELRSRRSPTRRRPGGLRVGGRIVLDRLSRRGKGAPRALDVETQLLVRLWHMRTYYAVVGAMLENTAVSLSHVPLAACTMGHAQLLASRDGAWLLRHEMEIAEEEHVGEPVLGAEAAAEMEGVGSRVQSHLAVDLINGLVSALRLGDGLTMRLLEQTGVTRWL
ncbi:unnamed protein product [Closterium sp. NIES-65]|nr:unnamed protein product [Closterium sp. NIES-65]